MLSMVDNTSLLCSRDTCFTLNVRQSTECCVTYIAGFGPANNCQPVHFSVQPEWVLKNFLEMFLYIQVGKP